MAGSRFTSRAYELRTEEAMAVSGTSEGTVDVELSIDAREGASGTSYGVTLTTDEEGKTVAEGTPSVSVTIPDDAVLSVGGTETKIPEEKPEPEGPTYQSIADAEDLTNAFKNGGYYRFTGDITAYDGTGLTATAEQASCYDIPGSTVVIDLAGHTLTSTVRLALTNGTDVTFSNGSVNLNVDGFSETQSALRLYSGSSLTLDDVDFSSNIVGLFFVYQNNNTTMRILNGSTVKTTAGAYAIGTNATEPNPSA